MGLGVLGPEFVLTYASDQWGTARDFVQTFHAAGYHQWTMRHAFFADMKGFLLIFKDSKPFRITAKHLHYLVSKQYISFPDVRSEDIWDRSKQNTIAKVVTCVRIFYLVLHRVDRAIQKLAITTMKLSTLAIVICSIMTSLC